MSFVLDQATVFNEFDTVISAEISDQLRAHIAGPHAALHRYSQASEKAGILLGAYNPGAAQTYNYPGRHVGSVIDLAYTKLRIDQALLRFFTDAIGSGVTLAPSGANKLVSNGAGFKTVSGYPRNTALKDRDVKKGDIVKIWDADVNNSFWTYVEDLVPEIIAAVRGTATADDNNADTQSADADVTQTGGGANQVEAAASGTYNGLASGDITETYTITVTTAGAPASARLSVRSASGRDDVASVTPSAFASTTAIGTRGLLITFSLDNTNSVDPGVDDDTFVVGQEWTATVSQAYTVPTVASGGTYTGNELDTTITYTVTISTGGTMGTGSPPSITVSRNDGTDASGPTVVPTSAQAVAIGSKGLTIAFTGTGLRKGDVYYVPVTSKRHGAYKTILLGQNMPSGLAVATDLNLSLYIRKDIIVPPTTSDASPTTNWTATQDDVTVEDGLTAYDSSLTDSGAQFAVPVIADSATLMYLEYREWLATYTNAVTPIIAPSNKADDALATVQAILGVVHPDNPLAYGVYKALLNNNGTSAYFTAVTDPSDTDSWAEIPPMLEGMKDVYSLVPLTDDATVHADWIAHCNERSDDSVGGEWRCCWLPLVAQPSVALVDEDSATAGGVAPVGTLTANTAVVGNPITLFTCTNAKGKFVTNGVQPGDILRFLYQTDLSGNVVHQEFPVASVTNEDVLVLATPHTTAVAVAQRFEVWRNQTRSQMTSAMVLVIQAAASKRVRYVWPDMVEDAGVSANGYHLCAALAGFVSGIAPHQSIRNVSFKGFDGVDGSVRLTNSQLNTLVAAGCVVVREDVSGNVYASYVRTSDPSVIDNSEEMVVRNDDAFSHFLYRRCQAYLGQTNVTDTGLALIQAGVTAAISSAKGGTLIDRIGTMITDGRIQELRAHDSEPDRVVLTVVRKRPYPANEATIVLVM